MSRPTLDLAEARQAIDGLTPAAFLRLGKAGRLLALGLSCEASDLLSDAICQTLQGRRNCPRDVPLVTFLIGAMRSRASAVRETQKASPVAFTLDATGTDGRPLYDPPALTRNVEEWRLAEEDVAARISALEELFAGDDEATMFLWADLEEMPKEEIKAMNDLTDSAYATIRRRMRRQISGRFPHGWPS